MKKEVSPLHFDDTEIAYKRLSNAQLKRAYHIYNLLSNPLLVKAGTAFSELALAIHFPIKPFVKPFIFKQFCGGETLKESQPVLTGLEENGVDVNLNFGVEIKDNERDFEKSFQQNKEAIAFAANKENVKVVSVKVSGIGYFNLLEKKQAKKVLNQEEQASFDRMKQRMQHLCALAYEYDVSIYWDAEESWVQDEIDVLVDEFQVQFNKGKAIVFNTIQLYRHDKLKYLKTCIARAKNEHFILGVKLVRGAYIEKENEWAAENNVPSKIHATKKAVDADYDEALHLCLDNIEHVSVCVASHNEESTLFTTQLMKEKGIASNNPNISFSQLYGMGDFITFNLAKQGYNAVKYLPFGPVREVIPYLIRRAQENSSIDGQMGRELSMLQKEMNRRKI